MTQGHNISVPTSGKVTNNFLLEMRSEIVNDSNATKLFTRQGECRYYLVNPGPIWQKYMVKYDRSIYACEYPIRDSQWGNLIGDYLEGVACADIAGLHFVNTAADNSSDSLFIKSFPKVIAHSHPNKDLIDAAVLIHKNCPKIGEYPYVYQGGWTQRLTKISDILLNAINTVYPNRRQDKLDVSSFSNFSFPHTGIANAESVPFVPDAVILFRCYDILLDYSHYGFINFNIYQALISNNSRSIYVLSEPLNYMGDGHEDKFRRDVCMAISANIMSHLRAHFPNAMIGMRRGHATDSIAMLSTARTVICAPSTFCLWPGIVNSRSQSDDRSVKSVVYFAPGRVMLNQVYINDRFQWIMSPGYIRLDRALTHAQKYKLNGTDLIIKSVSVAMNLLSAPISRLETKGQGQV